MDSHYFNSKDLEKLHINVLINIAIFDILKNNRIDNN